MPTFSAWDFLNLEALHPKVSDGQRAIKWSMPAALKAVSVLSLSTLPPLTDCWPRLVDDDNSEEHPETD
jgi:hypothetical protein